MDKDSLVKALVISCLLVVLVVLVMMFGLLESTMIITIILSCSAFYIALSIIDHMTKEEDECQTNPR